METEMALVDAEAEKHLEEHSILPEYFHTQYFTERAKLKTYAERNKASKL
jgi:hypothetical protein